MIQFPFLNYVFFTCNRSSMPLSVLIYKILCRTASSVSVSYFHTLTYRDIVENCYILEYIFCWRSLIFFIICLAAIIAKKGSDAWWYMTVDDLLPDKYRELASEYEKGTDTMDVWFDSGIILFHYWNCLIYMFWTCFALVSTVEQRWSQ